MMEQLAGGSMMAERSQIRVLLVEKESRLVQSFEFPLVKCGFKVDSVHDHRIAVESQLVKHCDLIILDLDSLGAGSVEIVKTIKKHSPKTPILVVTGHKGAQVMMSALYEGADDFLTKPFESDELCARVKTVLWRAGTASNSILQVGDLTMNLSTRTVQKGTKTIRLTRTEFSLLEMLMRNKNSILTREQIRESVWGAKFENSTNIVDVYINYLRNTIDNESSQRLIRTVRGRGFVLSEN
jgi:DNA-binding response OmpR family regulator